MTDELREAGLLTPEWTALEPKIFENLSLVGATGSAAVPLALDYGWKTGAIKQGDMVMLLAIETSKWKYGRHGAPVDGRAGPGGSGGPFPGCRFLGHWGGGGARSWPASWMTSG